MKSVMAPDVNAYGHAGIDDVIDNNLPEGDVSLTIRVNVLNSAGVQEQLSSSATVTVVK